jgi:aminoglycoside 6'-N-acetyltransferase
MPDQNFTEVVSDRIVLRRFSPADLDAFVAYRSVPEVARYQSWDAPYPMAKGKRMLADMAKTHPDTSEEWFQFAVALRKTNELVGDCGCKTSSEGGRQAEIGFTLAPEHQGNGYGAEAVRALLGYLFGSRGLHRVSAGCDARNTASARLMERVGMRLEGHRVGAYWAKGEWTDDLLYAILDSEWNTRPAAQAGGSGGHA